MRFGFIGAGRIARDFAEDLRGVPHAELAAVWSRTRDTSDGFVARFPETRALSNLDELVAAEDVDVVYVATPHHRHVSDSLLALRNGKSVLCEKPFATSHADAMTVVAEARSRELFCMEAMWMRFIPAIRRARELLDQGAIGEPRMLFADFGVATPFDANSRFFDPAQGGGALLDLGVYAVSLAHLMFGLPDAVVSLTSDAPTGVDEQIGAVLRFSEGRLAVLGAALGTSTPCSAVITGTAGRLHLEAPFYRPSRLSIISTSVSSSMRVEPDSIGGRSVAALKQSRLGSELVRAAKSALRPARVERLQVEGNGYGYEAAEVIRCLEAGEAESPLMPLDESLAVMDTLDRLRPPSTGFGGARQE